ncbi:YdcF family protein [Streptomyces sp. NBC_00878]|uniref:YdcF family protein n=1 Tax=Streptomyces sp. NBC_00878 TaxID=2975854 RepID=UPI002258C9D0|nr:YdcF family protein [Streptomyces sp. NBC_00878]MCX4902898.1 YdcF family protein [Streptomyces sp. NBC_00878]
MLASTAALFFVIFCVSVLYDPRRFSNAILLGIAVTLLPIYAVVTSVDPENSPISLAITVVGACALLGLGACALAFFLLANGVQMIRKEGRRPANLLSFLTGLAILGLIALLVVTVLTTSPILVRISGAVIPMVGYVSFLFLCFLGYAFLYGRLPVRRNVDFVIVLGSGLIGGSRVPRLLANRLDRGHGVYEAQTARGNAPVLVTSGGQGPDEALPEAHAMANYLVERGVPTDRIQREDRSRTTEENLRFSKAIMEELKPDYRCLVVTSNFHVFRAALLARRTGVRGHVAGAPTAAYFWPGATIREFIAVFLSHKVINLGICLALGLLGLALGVVAT